MSDEDEDEWLRRFLEEEERLLTKGDEFQKLSVIGSLPELLKYDQKGTVSKIIPKIQQELPTSSSEFNLAVSRMFNVLIHMDIPVNLTPQILQGIEYKDPIIANAWMDTLLAVIPLLKENVVKTDILKCAVSKSQLVRTSYYRVCSCKMLGRISLHKSMNPFEIKKDILPLVQSLCQDCYYEVRAAMCKELPTVAAGMSNLGDSVVKSSLLPILVELSTDENMLVRCSAIESVVAIIPYLTKDAVRTTIIPLMKKLCTSSVLDGDTTYKTIAECFGQLLTNLQGQINSNDAMWFLDYYSHISKVGQSLDDDVDVDPSINMMCRENCANCLSTVASMVLFTISSEITIKWYNTFKSLAADSCYLVRKKVAQVFGDIVNILGPSNKIVFIEFTKLLRDEDEEVLQALIPNIAVVLEQFLNSGVMQRDVAGQQTVDIGKAMLKCQNETFRTNNWRMKDGLLKQWERIPNTFPSDFIHQHFTPVVLNVCLHAKAKPVRSQATRTLLFFMRYSIKENHRKWTRETIILQLAQAECCFARQLFAVLCEHALEIFSWKYFKDHFYLTLLTLTEDPVCTVRYSVVKLCLYLKQILVLPADKALQMRLEGILARMEVVESDKAVLQMLKDKLREMREFKGAKVEDISDDKRRMEEEERIFRGKFVVVRNASMQLTRDMSGRDASIVSEATTSMFKSQTSISVKLPEASPMPFLDQHFFTDAGISLPQDFSSKELKLKTSTEVSKLIESAESLTSWLDEVSLASEDPVKEFHPKVVDKNRRNSCIFTRELRNSNVSRSDNSLKRRSLQISSKIPVRLFSEKSKSEQDLLKFKRFSASDRILNSVTKVSAKRSSGLPLSVKRTYSK